MFKSFLKCEILCFDDACHTHAAHVRQLTNSVVRAPIRQLRGDALANDKIFTIISLFVHFIVFIAWRARERERERTSCLLRCAADRANVISEHDLVRIEFEARELGFFVSFLSVDKIDNDISR